jgi:hypothetical protein
LTDNLSIKIEALYVDLGDRDLCNGSNSLYGCTNAEYTIHRPHITMFTLPASGWIGNSPTACSDIDIRWQPAGRLTCATALEPMSPPGAKRVWQLRRQASAFGDKVEIGSPISIYSYTPSVIAAG